MSPRPPTLPRRPRREPVGPWGHYVNDVLVRKGLSYRTAYESVNDAARAGGDRFIHYDRHTINNWMGGHVPRADALRWIALGWSEPIETVSERAEAHRAWRYEQQARAVASDAERAAARRTVTPVGQDHPLVPADEASRSLPLQPSTGVTLVRVADDELRPAPAGLSSPAHLELLRRSLHDALSESGTSDVSLVDWEQIVHDHGRATRDHPPGMMLADLTSDLVELRRALARCRASSTMRRLARVTAQMAGLMCLTLVKLDEREGFRNWARTARIAAQEAGDPETYSWVRAQEAYGHYYAGDLTHAIEVARDAQASAGRAPYVGAALAAALEARAHAALGNGLATRAALDHAEEILSRLQDGRLFPSAFGYSEAQLRFHEGSAFTHLHDTVAAWKAQERALALCPLNDYTDRTLTQLDRATCLAHDGDVSGAAAYAEQALAGLTREQRRGIITLRARGIVAALPTGTERLPAARELRDLIMSTTDTDETVERVITLRAAMPSHDDAMSSLLAQMDHPHGDPSIASANQRMPAVRDVTFGMLPEARALLGWNDGEVIVVLRGTVASPSGRHRSAPSRDYIPALSPSLRAAASGVGQYLDLGSPLGRIAP